MREPIRVGAVNYLNTKPLIENLESIAPEIALSLEVPSRLADQLAGGKIDVGLIPVIEYFRAGGLSNTNPSASWPGFDPPQPPPTRGGLGGGEDQDEFQELIESRFIPKPGRMSIPSLFKRWSKECARTVWAEPVAALPRSKKHAAGRSANQDHGHPPGVSVSPARPP